MKVIVIFWFCLLLTLLLAGLILVRQRKQLAIATHQETLNELQLKTLFSPNLVEITLSYVLLASMALLVWQTIRQSFDFSILLVVATGVSGLIYGLDVWWVKPRRQQILQKAQASIDNFDQVSSSLKLEPGLIENCRSFFPVLLVVLVLRSFLFEPFQIPSGSMKPTLEIGDFLLVNRFSYGLRAPISNDIWLPLGQPERGDVVVFRPPHEPNKNYIKRVVGLPGDRIQYDYNQRILRINGRTVPREFVSIVQEDSGRYLKFTEVLGDAEHSMYLNQYGAYSSSYEWLPIEGVVVPEGKYFVMGDNRDSSNDSRYWEGQRRQVQGDFTNRGENAWGFVDENELRGKAVFIWMHWDRWPTFSRIGLIE